MFELSIIRKYLIPRRKQLSVALIATMSVAVISLVVWLVVVFLSVTDGIEKTWLEKLTSLNAPLRITPTKAYFSSYYHLIDSVSSSSRFELKSIDQKVNALQSDPYDPECDPEVPWDWPKADKNPDGTIKDPVKIAYAALEKLKQSQPDLAYQDFEISAAMLRLQLLRDDTPSFLTQVTYLASFADQSPYLKALLLPPTIADLNHLFFISRYSTENPTQENPHFIKAPLSTFKEKIAALVKNIAIKELKTKNAMWRLPYHLLPEDVPFDAIAYLKNGKVSQFVLPGNVQSIPTSELIKTGKIVRKGNALVFDHQVYDKTPAFVQQETRFKAEIVPTTAAKASELKDIRFSVRGKLQGKEMHGEMGWDGVEIADAAVSSLPKLFGREKEIFLAKSLQENGAKVGDRGYLSYPAMTPSGIQEQRIAVYVAGFYDPGVMAVGNKCILVPKDVAHTVNGTSHTQHFDKTEASGIQVWFKDPKRASDIAKELTEAFQSQGIDAYWKISTYKDYDFAKDLLQQFQSDKYLFSLIGIIILTVACCNIISLLVLLVNDKKREIGILQAMGATPRSIALIFGGCGMAMGLLSSFLGIMAALLTLYNLDGLVHILSFLQGHDAFNAAFYGSSLPNQPSHEALLFVSILTPLLALIAGLVPAIKACRLKPSAILRSE